VTNTSWGPPSGFGIDQRFDERMSGREPLPFALDPVEEDFDLGLAVSEPIEL
jgi:hypothetical protein